MRLNVIAKPYDDEKLIFNPNTQRYELTIQFLKTQVDTPYKNDEETFKRIRLNSQVVYNYIRSQVATWNRSVVEFLLNKTEQGRIFLFEILSAQQYADIQTGYNDTSFMPAINFTGNDKNREDIKRNVLCVAAEQILNDSDAYFGVRINYRGQFPLVYYLLTRSN